MTELSENSLNTLNIEVAYATPEKQKIISLEIEQATSPRDAIKLSRIKDEFPEIDLDNVKIGVFGKPIPDNYQLREKDRIEIYRPLLADPKEVRRRLASEGKTMGKRKPQVT